MLSGRLVILKGPLLIATTTERWICYQLNENVQYSRFQIYNNRGLSQSICKTRFSSTFKGRSCCGCYALCSCRIWEILNINKSNNWVSIPGYYKKSKRNSDMLFQSCMHYFENIYPRWPCWRRENKPLNSIQDLCCLCKFAIFSVELRCIWTQLSCLFPVTQSCQTTVTSLSLFFRFLELQWLKDFFLKWSNLSNLRSFKHLTYINIIWRLFILLAGVQILEGGCRSGVSSLWCC